MTELTLVTGAGGFIGTYVVRRLLDTGRKVRVLVRRPQALSPEVLGLVQLHQGDIRDSAAVEAAVSGTHTVLHMAACARAWVRDEREFHATNSDAVAVLLRCAAQASVQRLVHVSTSVTLAPYAPAPGAIRRVPQTPYQVSKSRSERLVRAYAASGRHAVIVHPTRVYGPGPLNDANGVTRIVALYLRGLLRFRLGDRGAVANYVHADDVAQGIVLAASLGKSGAHYVLGDENATFPELLRLIGKVAGVHPLVMPVPPTLAVAAARLLELYGLIGGTCPITAGWVRTLLEDRRADITPARRDLGFVPRGLTVGMAETVEWLRTSGRTALHSRAQ